MQPEIALLPKPAPSFLTASLGFLSSTLLTTLLAVTIAAF